ncbi:MAG: ABC transporter substrate-binding protein, partial [Syntrophus sp. (in: bacteria)]
MKNRSFGRVFLSWIIIAGLTGIFAGPAAAADTIKLGVAGSHSGDLASYGLPTKRAAELVAKEFNAKGGVLGKKVEILSEDDVCKPELATNTATKLVSRGAHVVLGHICSGATKTALGIYKDAGIVTMSS